ncbi:MAG: hypothetical protein AB7V77_04070 [Candidatus Woesearchaeota archaeon]
MLDSKKAMSPLIATVFLIAFAVAIGVMIMNWTPSEPEVVNLTSESCKNVKIEMLDFPCFSNNELTFSIKNLGTEKISALTIYSSYKDVETSIRLKSSSLVPTETLSKTISFMYQGGVISLNFVPLYYDGKDYIECTEQGIYVSSLKYCN